MKRDVVRSGSGFTLLCGFIVALSVRLQREKNTCYPNESLRAKDAPVHRLWIRMIIFKTIFTNVVAVEACVSECVSACVSGDVDCILYGMFNVLKKKKKLKSPLLPDFGQLSGTVWQRVAAHWRAVQSNAISVPPTTTEIERIVYWTQAYVFFFLFSFLPF